MCFKIQCKNYLLISSICSLLSWMWIQLWDISSILSNTSAFHILLIAKAVFTECSLCLFFNYYAIRSSKGSSILAEVFKSLFMNFSFFFSFCFFFLNQSSNYISLTFWARVHFTKVLSSNLLRQFGQVFCILTSSQRSIHFLHQRSYWK